MSDESHDFHYELGKEAGYDEGYREGKTEGYEVGYDHGEMTFYEGGMDNDIERLIKDGEFDYIIKERSEKLGYVKPEDQSAVTAYGEGALQLTHSVMHTSGPTSWEFCGRPPCSKVR